MKIKIISFIAGAIIIVIFMVLKNAISIKLGNRIDVPEIKLTLTYTGKNFYWCLRNNSANTVILDKRALHLSRIIQCRLIATGDYIGPLNPYPEPDDEALWVLVKPGMEKRYSFTLEDYLKDLVPVDGKVGISGNYSTKFLRDFGRLKEKAPAYLETEFTTNEIIIESS